jgi:hypothetical protein
LTLKSHPSAGQCPCSGATTSDVANAQLSALNRGTRLVILTVGGNDLDVSGVATACIIGTPPACQAAINNALAVLAVGPGGESVLGGRITDLYAGVADAVPKALVVVTGYPYLFDPPAPAIRTRPLSLQ